MGKQIQTAPASSTVMTMEDGQQIELTLNWSALQRLRARRRDLYKSASRIILQGTDDIVAMGEVVYAAHLCSLYQSGHADEDAPGQKEFMANLPDIMSVMIAFNQLVDPKGKAASAGR